MKIFWRFATPHSPTGYGATSREIPPRMIKDGHEVMVVAPNHSGSPINYGGIPVMGTPSSSTIVNFLAESEGIDYIFAPDYYLEAPDVPYRNWVACGALDFEFMFPRYTEQLRNAEHMFAPSNHNLEQLRSVGFDPFYAPWGVNTKSFKPDQQAREAFRSAIGIDDETFLIGAVGENLIDDRKNFVNLVKAFQLFFETHYDAVLYIHTFKYSPVPLYSIVKSSGFVRRILFGSPKQIAAKALTEGEMIKFYNGLDVFCSPSKGESFCLPLLESQSCGCPAITANTTAMPEHLKGGWLIPVEDDDYELSQYQAWQARVRPKAICEQLENAYNLWERGELGNLGKGAREGVLEYDWDNVYEQYWKPFLSYLADRR